eukprot:5911963-Heterocapsa_arctica.AAC.1
MQAQRKHGSIRSERPEPLRPSQCGNYGCCCRRAHLLHTPRVSQTWLLGQTAVTKDICDISLLRLPDGRGGCHQRCDDARRCSRARAALRT